MRLLLHVGSVEWGGAEVMVRNLLGALGDHVRPTLMGVDSGVLERVVEGRPTTEVLRVPRIVGSRDWATVRDHRRVMRRARPDVVQLNLPVPFSEPWTLLGASTLPGVRVIAVEHLPMPMPSAKLRAVRRVLDPRLAAEVAVGGPAARELEGLRHRPPGSIRVVWNGVPVPVPGAAPARPRGARVLVGGVGRLHEQKGFDVLVRALALLPHDVHVVLVGDGPEAGALRALARDLGVADRLTLTGWVERPSSWYAALDVLAMPSRFEGLPLVLLEALHVGVPVVATPVGSIGDAVRDGDTGLLVPVGDAEALAAAVGRLVSEADLGRRIAVAGRALAAERFTVAAMARSYEALYDEVLGPR